jgi:hypothetical protein
MTRSADGTTDGGSGGTERDRRRAGEAPPGVPVDAPRWAVLPAQVPLEDTWTVVPVDPPSSPERWVAGLPLAGGALAADDD